MDNTDLYHWFLMGGYGWFVWPAYIVGVAVLLYNLIYPLYRHRRLSAQLRHHHASQKQ